jgi:putative two-component system response regulator
MPRNLTDSTILVVDDELANVHLLRRFLSEAEFSNVISTTNSGEVIDLFKKFQPDLLLLDLRMPFPDGFEVMDQLRKEIQHKDYVPILVLTADITNEAKQKALSSGAKDFLTKPLDFAETLLRISNLLDTRLLHLEIQDHNHLLEQKVRDRTRELEESQIEILERLAMTGEYRDYKTGEHTRRVGSIAAALAKVTGASPREVKLIRLAAPLHDIGKVGIPDSILLKSGKLESAEWDVMRLHTKIGARILSGSRHELLKIASTIAMAHHEWWDGTGYPDGLVGVAIPYEARIVAIVDLFDALTSERPYKRAWPVELVLAEIKQQSGKHFDPDLVRAFLELAACSDLFALAKVTQSSALAAPNADPGADILHGHDRQARRG